MLIRWTIRVALIACVARMGLELWRRPGEPASDRLRRLLWTTACVLIWLHVAAAFQFEHHWNQAAAFEQTARETQAVTGFDWGGGLWINYALMLAWLGDVTWWWLGPTSFRARPAIIDRLWLGFVAFIAFNATVVFKSGTIRWCGIAITALLVLLVLRRRSPERVSI